MMQGTSVPFETYIARSRTFEDLSFDLIIADQIGKQWYDASPNQLMFERVWCKRHIREGDTVVDCGAHQGIMSVLFSFWAGDTGKIIAFEPSVANADLIRRNAELNGRSNIEVHARALGANSGWKKFSSRDGTLLEERMLLPPADVEMIIQTIPLDQIICERNVDFIKIDVEGCELELLQGAQKVMGAIPSFDLEVHCFLHEDKVAFLDDLLGQIPWEQYHLEIQPTFVDVPEPLLDARPDVHWLSQFENPHLFGVPKSRVHNDLRS